MTRVDLHPEDLFDQLRAGELRRDERERLHNHCERCSACAFELQLIESNGTDVVPDDLDRAIAARAMDRMLSIDETPVRTAARSRGVFRAAALIVAGVLVGGSMSAAALTGSSPFVLVDLITAWVTPAPHTQNAAPASVAARNGKRHSPAPLKTAVAKPAVIAATAIAQTAPESAVTEPVAAPIAPVRTSTPFPAPASVASPPVPTAPAATNPDPATSLFGAASRARADGRYREALVLYAVLRREFAGSEVEVVARVALGRLWLSQLDDPSQALNAFNSYLEARPAGPLAEEARSGRISALRKLGRDVEAEAAMQDLVARHPHSLYATPTAAATP